MKIHELINEFFFCFFCFVIVASLPTIACPAEQSAAASLSGSTAPMVLPAVVVRDPLNINNLLPVTYLTSPMVTLNPASPNTEPTLTGSFNLGVNYVLAHATYNGQTVACFYTVRGMYKTVSFITYMFFEYALSMAMIIISHKSFYGAQ